MEIKMAVACSKESTVVGEMFSFSTSNLLSDEHAIPLQRVRKFEFCVSCSLSLSMR
jgi:hypothetical protein